MFRFSRVSDILIITLYANLYWRTAVAVKRPIHRNLQMFSSSLWLLPSHMLFFHSCELYCLQQNARHFEFSQLNTQLILSRGLERQKKAKIDFSFRFSVFACKTPLSLSQRHSLYLQMFCCHRHQCAFTALCEMPADNHTLYYPALHLIW